MSKQDGANGPAKLAWKLTVFRGLRRDVRGSVTFSGYARPESTLYFAGVRLPHNEPEQVERMTTLYLDTEFNGFKGPLISMALVSPEGDEWYQVVECEGEIDPWVAENVMPKLGKAAISKAEFSVQLHKFIRQFDDPLIVCDWHADLMHFFEAFHGADYRDSLDFRCRTLLLSGASDVRPIAPHNALSDACALRDCFDGRHPI